MKLVRKQIINSFRNSFRNMQQHTGKFSPSILSSFRFSTNSNYALPPTRLSTAYLLNPLILFIYLIFFVLCCFHLLFLQMLKFGCKVRRRATVKVNCLYVGRGAAATNTHTHHTLSRDVYIPVFQWLFQW